MKQKWYDEKNIKLIENSSDEIVAATKDMLEFINNNYRINDANNATQIKFLKIYRQKINEHNLNFLHGKNIFPLRRALAI